MRVGITLNIGDQRIGLNGVLSALSLGPKPSNGALVSYGFLVGARIYTGFLFDSCLVENQTNIFCHSTRLCELVIARRFHAQVFDRRTGC